MNKEIFERLEPANFAFIMATGVISIAFHLTGWPAISLLFLIVGTLGYICLVVLFLLELIICGGQRIVQGLKNIPTLFKWMTFSAGSNALAERYTLAGYNIIGSVLVLIGAITTVLLIYAIFWILIFEQKKLSLQSVSPFWLLMAIACNSVGIVITALWANNFLSNPIFVLFAFSFWTFGVFVYVIFMTLNVYRWFSLPFETKDMNAAYWTCMGAAAIAVVDGSKLIIDGHSPAFLNDVKPFLKGVVLALWTWGTAWIPILLFIGICKHFYHKLPAKYEPSLWAMVFPLGMYTVATHYLTLSVHADILNEMVPICLWTACVVWLIVAFKSRFNPFTGSL